MRLLDKLDRLSFFSAPTCHWSGDDVAAGAEKSSANFQNTLQNAFNIQFGNQSSVLSFLNGKLTGQVKNPEGFGQPTLNAMRTSATDTVAKQYQDAKRAMQVRTFGRGGEMLPSGVDAQIGASIDAAGAGAEATTQNEITQKDAELKQQNYWNAINGLSGVAAAYNPNGVASNANGAASDVASLSSAVTAANGPTPASILTGVGTGILSSGMTNMSKGLSFFGKH